MVAFLPDDPWSFLAALYSDSSSFKTSGAIEPSAEAGVELRSTAAFESLGVERLLFFELRFAFAIITPRELRRQTPLSGMGASDQSYGDNEANAQIIFAT